MNNTNKEPRGSTLHFTPGPWNLAENDTHAGQIAAVYGCEDSFGKPSWLEVWSMNWPENSSQQAANAALIAAAPDMYEALQDLWDDWLTLTEVDADDPDVIKLTEQTMNALAKARGE
jgi:hypothetical protein